MLHSSKKSAKLNQFELKAIPRCRDLFIKYGSRVGSSGSFGSTADSPSHPVCNSRTVIGQLIDAQNYLAEVTKVNSDSK